MAFFSYSKDYSGFIDIVLDNPDRYLPIVQFLDKLVCQQSELSQLERELIGAYVSLLNGCDFCYGVHEAIAKSFNVDAEILLALKTDVEQSSLEPKLKAIFILTKKITENPGKIVASDIQAVIDAGWHEKTVEDVIGIASLFAFLNRLVDGFGLKGSESYFNKIGEGFSKFDGYESFVRSELAY
ncbi:MAG: peroxidase-related enzyme [Methylococcaceae bacterium]|nr:peroxidase-related enzyme [Methylococcaceae bacterium]